MPRADCSKERVNARCGGIAEKKIGKFDIFFKAVELELTTGFFSFERPLDFERRT